MKVYELLDINKEMLERICLAGIKAEDYKYAPLFAEYEQLRDRGEKKTYIVAMLSQRYEISERKTYSIIANLSRELSYCTISAAG